MSFSKSNQEEWRRIILSINDSTFFDLMRNYLGKIQTPFNKQDLINRLINFFTREEIIEKVISLIDRKDGEVLTAISLSGGLTEMQLRSFFPSWTYLEMIYRIRNLEERFLIYRKNGLCFLSPLFEEKLKQKIISPALLIKTKPVEPSFDPPLWFNDQLMTALYSVISKEKNLFKNNGSIKKRGSDNFENLFPSVPLESCIKILINLRLVEIDEGAIKILEEQWLKLSDLSIGERFALYCGAALSETPYNTEAMTKLFVNFYTNFPQSQRICVESFNAFCYLYCSDKGLFKPEKALETFKDLNIIIEENDTVRLNSMLDLHYELEEFSEKPLIVQPNFDITVKPFIPFKECLKIIPYLTLEHFDIFTRYKLEKSSFLKGLKNQKDEKEFISLLQNLSGKELAQNIKVSLQDWAEDSKKAQIYRGIILKVTPDKQDLIEKTSYLDPYILETLSEGIYLLDGDREALWTEALTNLSINPAESGIKIQRSEYTLPHIHIPQSKNTLFEKPPLMEENDSREANKSLLKTLDENRITGDEKKELEARIERKLIFHSSQINKGIVRPEITEARGMNFQGKVRLVEAALQNPSDRLELSYFTGGETQTILVQPLELKKEDQERILIGKILPEEESITIRIGKISRIRKLKSSLF